MSTVGFRSEGDPWKRMPLSISGRSHVKIREAIIDFHGSDVTFRSDESGRATSDVRRFVVDSDTMGFHLERREDGLAKRHGCHLMPDTNAFAQMGADYGSKRAKTCRGDTMVVNAMDVNRSPVPFEETHVGASNAAVGTAINKSAVRIGMVCGNPIQDLARIARIGISCTGRVGMVSASSGRNTIVNVLTFRPAPPDRHSV